jgi:hypothetical protein
MSMNCHTNTCPYIGSRDLERPRVEMFPVRTNIQMLRTTNIGKQVRSSKHLRSSDQASKHSPFIIAGHTVTRTSADAKRLQNREYQYLKLKLKLHYNRQSVRCPSRTHEQFFFLLEISFIQFLVCYFVAPSLTRGWACNLSDNCFWALPEQPLLGRSPAELSPYFTVSSETPPGTEWPSYVTLT